MLSSSDASCLNLPLLDDFVDLVGMAHSKRLNAFIYVLRLWIWSGTSGRLII